MHNERNRTLEDKKVCRARCASFSYSPYEIVPVRVVAQISAEFLATHCSGFLRMRVRIPVNNFRFIL